MLSRNAFCPCGSGRKVKVCHVDLLGGSSPAAPEAPATLETPTVTTLLAEAEDHLVAGRMEEAVATAERAMALEPGNALALSVLAMAAHRMGDLTTAGTVLVQAVALEPASGAIRRRLAAVLFDLQLVDEALAQLDEAIRLAPEDPEPLVDLARHRMATGDPAAAATLLARARDLNPSDHGTLKALVWLHMHQGDAAAGQAAYEQLLQSERDQPRRYRPDPQGEHVAAGPVEGVRSWAERRGAPLEIVVAAAPLAIDRPRYSPDRVGPLPARVMRPDRYVAVVADATVIGRESAVIAPDGVILSDVAVHEDADRFDLVRGAVRYMDRRVALVDTTAAAPLQLDRAVVLTGAGSPNYYHWLLEHLTRLQTLEFAADDRRSWPVLVDAQAMAIPQLRAALQAVAGPRREVVALDPRARAQVREAAVVSPGAWLPIDLRDGLMLEPRDCIIDPAAIAWLRERLLPPDLREDRQGSRRIYLGRSTTGRLQNASALGPVLAAHGVETVLPERMSLGEQLALFADASLVVAESGAALTNIAFAPSSARVIVIGADRWDLTLFSQIAGHRGQRHLYVAGTPIPGSAPKLYQSKCTIAPADLDRALRDTLEEMR